MDATTFELIDGLLEAGQTFDWLTPMIDIYKTLDYGPSTTFILDRRCGRSLGSIQRLLRKNGVEIWNVDYTPDTIQFSVREPQAQWADYLLRHQAGLPVMLGAPQQPVQKPQGKIAPPRPAAIPADNPFTLDTSLTSLREDFDSLFSLA